MVEAKILKRDEPMAEKPVAKRANQKLKEVKLEVTIEVEQSPYDKLPFPQRVLTKAQKKVISKFRKDLSDIGIKLPAISGMREAHVQMMLIKDIVDHQAEVAELLNISTMKLDPPVTPKSLPKLESQGKFTLSCSLGKLTFDDALVDSGATVNVISMEMMKSLEIEHMEPDTSTLTFGDSSSTTPIGLIKDFPLKIGSCTIPIDLTVLKMFPCTHAIAAGNKHENDYVDEFFSNERFTLAYSESVYPVGDKAYWDIPPHVASFLCRPPSTRFPSGRRKKKEDTKFVRVWKISAHIQTITQVLQM
ncbi:PREDICTED: uncharacterized protein LOC106297880 [Brassica oleracea var. oleracea]|uniref:uncharacterized protein LOC106297880 n=1 Tax=Brassica oleracea var. oleracea TaxID=109376 RepID=UPI0006A75230|nr:PREDICTED: uncharacterized protein LOC106297880 [Brassica oleracea var. oleracea]